MLKDLAMRVFLIHLTAFIAGILICAEINLWLTPDTLWFPWVLIGWGAAIATHAFALLLRMTRRRELIFIDPKARRFAVHLFAYVATVLILLYVNLTVTPNVWWFYWVALGWGIGIIAHGWCAFGKRRQKSLTLPGTRAAKPAAKPRASKKGSSPAAKRSSRTPRTRKKSS